VEEPMTLTILRPKPDKSTPPHQMDLFP